LHHDTSARRIRKKKHKSIYYINYINYTQAIEFTQNLFGRY